jgi:membrane protease subunit HflC
MKRYAIVLAALLFLALVVLVSSLYVVDETQQVVITQFGESIGEPIRDAGLYFKSPFIQRANYFERRILEWDGRPNQIPTRDKKYIWVDTTARWRIADPLKFLQSVSNETGAQARLDDIIDSATRDAITSHLLVEAVRNTNQLLERATEELEELGTAEALEQIEVGREKLTREILEQARELAPPYGIELIDVRIKRIDYVTEVRQKVYERMISERRRAAEQYRSEGQGKKAEIDGEMAKELKRITSEAYRTAQEIEGKADAEAIRIYAEAYSRDPEFYSFLKTLETYKETIDSDTTIILSTDSAYFEYLEDLSGPEQAE